MITPIHARMARSSLGWSQMELKNRTGLSKTTLIRFEAGLGVHYKTAQTLEAVFTKEGLTFLYEDNAHGPGVLLSKDLSRRLSQEAEKPKTPNSRKRSQKT